MSPRSCQSKAVCGCVFGLAQSSADSSQANPVSSHFTTERA
jgi:hypothetical protein